MAQQTINLGAAPNDSTGDTLRVGGDKINDNFDELYTGFTDTAYTTDKLSVFAATTSAELKTVISDETGSGALVFANTPTLVTPVLGVATGTSFNKVTITAPATSAILTIVNGKTATISNTLTLAGTDSTVMTFPTTSATIARTDAEQTLTGIQTIDGNLYFGANKDIGTNAAGASSPRNIYNTNDAVIGHDLITGHVTQPGRAYLKSGASAAVSLFPKADGRLMLSNWNDDNFDRLQFGGTTSSFPSLKRSTTVLQARLADDSAFAPLQGNLRTQANAVAETPTATHTMIITDAGGTAYRVLCVV